MIHILQKKDNSQINIENFYLASKGHFKVCKKPKRKPDYISYKNKKYGKYILEETKVYLLFEDTDEDLYKKITGVEILNKLKKKYRFENIKILHFELFDSCRIDKSYFFEFCVKLTYTEPNGISSRYWYGKDRRGEYVIRESDHWKRVASCHWTRSRDFEDKKYVCAKAYIKNNS